MNKIKWKHCIILSFAIPWTLQAQTTIAIDKVGDSAVRGEVKVGWREQLVGTLTFSAKDSMAPADRLVLQVARRRDGESGWWIQPAEQWLTPAARQARWRVGVTFGTALGDAAPRAECGERFEILALVTRRPLPAGLLDAATLRRSSLVSSPVRVRRRPCEALKPGTPIAMIRIDSVGESYVRPGVFYEVRLQESVHGVVVKPKAAVVRLVVQPIVSTHRWVMEQDPQVFNGHWSSMAQFGRVGLDEWDDFLVYAIVADPRLPTGRGLSPQHWDEYERRWIQATSDGILVRRVEIPFRGPGGGVSGSPQVVLRIKEIEDITVDEKKTWPVDRKSGLTGTVQGRSISLNENVWVLKTSSFDDSAWSVLGKASLWGNQAWKMPPRILGEPGDYVDLIAVLSKQRVDTLSDDEVRKNMPISRRVHVVIKDRPPLSVIFTAIDNRGLTGRRVIESPPWAKLEGTVAGRPIEAGETVLVFKLKDLEGEKWQLFGVAPFLGKGLWELAPNAPLGKAGDRLYLMAVVSKQEIRELSKATSSQVVASSEMIQLTLRQLFEEP